MRISSREGRGKSALSLFFSLLSAVWIAPIVIVLYNSFKTNDAIKGSLFSLPTGDSFAGFSNFIKGMTFGGYPFYNSVFYSLELLGKENYNERVE